MQKIPQKTLDDKKAAAKVITPAWLQRVKKEIESLESHGEDRNDFQVLIPNVQGLYLGDVNDHRVFAVVANQVMTHYYRSWTTGGNHERYSWIPKRQIWISRLLGPDEGDHDCLHEIVETEIMASLGWPYDRAHEVADAYEYDFMIENGYDKLLPTKKDKPCPVCGKTDCKCDQNGKIQVIIRLPWETPAVPAKAKAPTKP